MKDECLDTSRHYVDDYLRSRQSISKILNYSRIGINEKVGTTHHGCMKVMKLRKNDTGSSEH